MTLLMCIVIWLLLGITAAAIDLRMTWRDYECITILDLLFSPVLIFFGMLSFVAVLMELFRWALDNDVIHLDKCIWSKKDGQGS